MRFYTQGKWPPPTRRVLRSYKLPNRRNRRGRHATCPNENWIVLNPRYAFFLLANALIREKSVIKFVKSILVVFLTREMWSNHCASATTDEVFFMFALCVKAEWVPGHSSPVPPVESCSHCLFVARNWTKQTFALRARFSFRFRIYVGKSHFLAHKARTFPLFFLSQSFAVIFESKQFPSLLVVFFSMPSILFNAREVQTNSYQHFPPFFPSEDILDWKK